MTLVRHSLLGGAVVAYAVPDSANIAAAQNNDFEIAHHPRNDASEKFLNAFMLASDRLSESLKEKDDTHSEEVKS